MGKQTVRFAKRIVVVLAVLAMTLASIPTNNYGVLAATKEEVTFKSADHHKMTVGTTYDFDLKNKVSGATYKWTSSNPKIATVNQKGVVKALTEGTTTIACKVTKGKKVTEVKAKVYVVSPKKELPTSLKINNKVSELAIGEQYDFNRTFSPKKSSDYVNWVSSNTNVAIVDKNGVVTALSEGTAKIKAISLSGKLKDSVSIKVSNSVTASNQKDIERFLKAEGASKITIMSFDDVELTIPEGDYSNKELVVSSPKATINNYGVFKSIDIKSIKGETWKEFAKNNKLNILCNASVIIAKSAVADIVIGKVGVKVNLQVSGNIKVHQDVRSNINIDGDASANITIISNAKDAQVHTKLPINLEVHAKIVLDLLTKEAADTKVLAENESAIPVITGSHNIQVTIGDKLVVVTPEPKEESKPTETPSQAPVSGVGDPNRIPVDKDGLDANGRAIAYFGAPDEIDGEIDAIWQRAEPVRFKNYRYNSEEPTKTRATIKVLWDDNAVYFLAEVHDENLSLASGNVYEKDSIEFFLDQDNKRCGTYEGDDCQFRINYHNEKSVDHGDLTNLYTAAKELPDGYIIEGRVSLMTVPANGVVMGFEAQLNDGVGSGRAGTISVFDTTGTAYQDTSKLGEILLTGKKTGDVTKPNFYDLKSLVAMASEIELERYINGDVVTKLIEASENAIADRTTPQERYDELMIQLQTAIDNLMHNRESFDEKECRDIPKAYKTSDPECQRGTIQMVTYKTNTYDEKNKELDKYMLVYVPNGYDENDKTKKYNVMYLIHGMAESQHTAFGWIDQNTELMRVADNLIAEGKMEPMIIVTPTWYNNVEGDNPMFLIKNFHNELTKDIIPTIESTYNVYAKSTSLEDLIAAREHRAVGGFSMGSACTWYNYIYSIDYFKYYVPISLWCWQDRASIEEECGKEKYTSENDNEVQAQYLADIAREHGYTKDDIRIFCATGTDDLAFGGMNAQIEEMKKIDDMFVYSADLRKGNFYYSVLPGGAHNWTCVDRYLYNILPDLFQDVWTDDYGMTEAEAPTATATFGSPIIDGKMDMIWTNATPIIPKYSTTPENTKATFRAMWDDEGLYILAQVKDSNVSKDSTNPYEQDSLEIFLDQKNDKTEKFGVDDLQFRINYANDITADKGDLLRLVSATSLVEGGYLIEARIGWEDIKPENSDVFGIELQINDGKGASRVGTINTFDGTGNAWQDTSLFGNIVLKGKTEDSVTPVNPYKVIALVRSMESLDASEYKNFDALMTAMENAMLVVNNPEATQEMLDEQYNLVIAAREGLEYTEEAAKVKRFVVMPSEYKAFEVSGSALSVSGGAIVHRKYDTLVKDSTTDKVTKEYNVYLPNGYDPMDTEKKYNVFYLMHGGGENENTLFGGEGENFELKRILDIMIAKGEIDPMIVVTPSFYKGQDDTATFYKELLVDIIPAVETEFNTYMEGTGTLDEIKASREHRAFGGFSMGSACTWAVFANCLNYIKYYVPLSGECWCAPAGQQAAEFLRDVVLNAETQDFMIYAATGSADIAYPRMNAMMEDMKKFTDVFKFDQDITVGNTYFMVADSGTHAWNFVNQYLWNIFPDLFK